MNTTTITAKIALATLAAPALTALAVGLAGVSFATRMGPPVGHQLWTTCLAHWG